MKILTEIRDSPGKTQAELLHQVHLDRSAEVLAGVHGVRAELLLDSQDLVVLGQSLRTTRCTSLNLAGRQADHQIGDERVLGLAGSVRNHRAPATLLGQ